MNLNRIKAIVAILTAIIAFSACDKEVDLSGDITGIWQLNATLEDGVDIPLADSTKNTKIIFKENGLYQLYSANEGITRHGTWLFSPDDRLDMSMDRKNNEDRHKFSAYEPCPVVFLINEVNSQTLEIKHRNTSDERKRFVMFTTMEDEQSYTDLQAAIAAETDIDQKRILERQLMDMDQKMTTYTFTFSRINP